MDQRRFFVLSPGVFDYVEGDATVWEKAPIERLAADGQLMAFRHTGFWQPMDTLRERICSRSCGTPARALESVGMTRELEGSPVFVTGRRASGSGCASAARDGR